jgi:hypothetical protein
MPETKHAIVLVATSLVGPFLCERLAAAGYTGECISRNPSANNSRPQLPFCWRRDSDLPRYGSPYLRGSRPRPVIVALPSWLLSLVLRLARLVSRSLYSPVLFDRMNQDLTFDSSAARAALGFDPRPYGGQGIATGRKQKAGP